MRGPQRLFPSDFGHPLLGEPKRIRGTATVRDDDGRDGCLRLDEFGDRPAHPDFHIVRMGADNDDVATHDYFLCLAGGLLLGTIGARCTTGPERSESTLIERFRRPIPVHQSSNHAQQ